MVLLKGPTGWRFLISEILLYSEDGMLGVREKKLQLHSGAKKTGKSNADADQTEREVPLPSEYGTYKTVKARFWP